MTGPAFNTLDFGDVPDVRAKDLPDEPADLIDLRSPFSSKLLYCAFVGGSLRTAFDDTRRWLGRTGTGVQPVLRSTNGLIVFQHATVRIHARNSEGSCS